MFTLTTNLAIWMAAVVDESVHQAHSHSNASHSRLAPDRECPVQGTLWPGDSPASGWVLCALVELVSGVLTREECPSCSGL